VYALAGVKALLIHVLLARPLFYITLLCSPDRQVPTVGVGQGLLAVHRASQISVTRLCDWVAEGYNKVR